MSKLVIFAWCFLALVCMSALFTETKQVFYKRLLVFMLLLAMSFVANWLSVPLIFAFIAMIAIINLQNKSQSVHQNQSDFNIDTNILLNDKKPGMMEGLIFGIIIVFLLIGWFGFLLVDIVDTFKLLTFDTNVHVSGWLDLWRELKFHWSSLLWPLIPLSILFVLSIHFWFSKVKQDTMK